MKNLSVSVRFLVEQTLLSGDLAGEGGEQLSPLEGLQAQQQLQKLRPENYRSEITVSGKYENDDYSLQVQGRLDGIFEDEDHTVIEEIKSTRKDLEFFKKRENQVHWGQAKIYAFLVAREEGLKNVDTQLTYINVDNRKRLETRREFSLDELSEFFHQTAETWLRWKKVQEEWIETRNHSLNQLQFPFHSYRTGQREMAIFVYRSIRDQQQLLAQAPTGIGKTMAVIFPALKTQGGSLVKKVFYLTARTTGKNIAQSALQVLRGKGARIRSVNLTAKDKICFKQEKACDPEECEFARGYYDRLAKARWDLIQKENYDRSAVEDAAREYRLCPFELSLDLSSWTDVIIGDYNYVFDPRVYLRRHFPDELTNDVFIVDEAHNLVDRAREMHSAILVKKDILELRRKTFKSVPELAKRLSRINSWFLKKKKKLAEGETAEQNAPAGLAKPLWDFLNVTEQWLSNPQNKTARFRKEISDAYFEIFWFRKVLDSYDESYSTCFNRKGSDIRVKLFCKDPSSRLKIHLKRCRSAIFLSATLTPLDYFRQLFGCSQEAGQLTLPSPFPKDNLCTIIHRGISTTFKDRENSKTDLANSIAEFVRQKPGNYLVFFPSYRYLESVRKVFEEISPETRLIIQDADMPESRREEFLDEFGDNTADHLIGFAVMGGFFGEGIDLAGDRLTGAVVVGVGLPAICLERELIRSYFAENGRNGFDFSYRYPGINRVLQAAGRVIRSENDLGAVMLVGNRFSRYEYQTLLPHEWQTNYVDSHRQISRILRAFWDR